MNRGTEQLRVAVVDDHPCARDGFITGLEQWPHGRVVLEAGDGLELERKMAEVGHIHIALVDLLMPERDGFETMAWLARHHPRTLCIAISFDTCPQNVKRALRAGARAVVDKCTTATELRKVMDHVRTHGFYYNDLVSRELRRAVETETEKRPNAADLTPREREFLLAYTAPPYPGLAAMGTKLGLKPSGVESLRKAVVERTKCNTRPQMIDYVREHGVK